jgi:hypothetical protein
MSRLEVPLRHRKCRTTGDNVLCAELALSLKSTASLAAPNPVLREAALDNEPLPIAWLGGRSAKFTFG